jgi:hypothetical protein
MPLKQEASLAQLPVAGTGGGGNADDTGVGGLMPGVGADPG